MSSQGPESVAQVVALLAGRPWVALTGAGCSTESGIPDYRGPTAPPRRREPMRYLEFCRSATARQRYWARSFVGWPRIAGATPNPGHRALAALEATGALAGIITQNVDGLHCAAGTRRLIELHGSLHEVRCLECGAKEKRELLQRRLAELNPWALEAKASHYIADGDADLSADLIQRFRVPVCCTCAGVLKPDVVFFGENVPPPVVERAWRLYATAEVLVVIGSSLTVFSGYRFVKRAREEGKPVVIVNLGPTRGDRDAAYRVSAPTGEWLPLLASELRPLGARLPASRLGPGLR